MSLAPSVSDRASSGTAERPIRLSNKEIPRAISDERRSSSLMRAGTAPMAPGSVGHSALIESSAAVAALRTAASTSQAATRRAGIAARAFGPSRPRASAAARRTFDSV